MSSLGWIAAILAVVLLLAWFGGVFSSNKSHVDSESDSDETEEDSGR